MNDRTHSAIRIPCADRLAADSCRVLIVAPDAGDALSIAEMLGQAGRDRFAVERVDGLEGALGRLRDSAADILILDVGLAAVEGLRSVRRARAENQVIPVILLCGLGDEALESEAAEVGASDCLVKGRFDCDALVRSIRYAWERKHACDALLASEERFRRLLENAPDILYRYRLFPEPGFDYVSTAILATLGYTPEELHADPELVVRRVHPDDRAHLGAALRGALPSGPPCVVRWRHRDGRLVWTEHRITNLRDDTGRLIALEGICRDITQRIQSNEEYRVRTRALEAAANAVLITDVEGIIEWVNPAFAALTGYASAEVIGRNPRLLSSGTQDASFYEDLWRTIRAGRVWTGEIENQRKDGSRYREEMTITPVLADSGAITHFVAIKQDVTQRREAEAARLESDQRFREIAETMQEVFWISDPTQTRMIYVSPAYEQIWGRTCASLYLEPLSFVEAIHPDDRQRIVDGLRDYGRGGTYERVYRIQRPDGSQRWIHARAFPVRSADGEIVRMVGSAQDITDLKEAEQELLLQKETLQTVVDNIPVAVNFFDAEGRLVFANREFERLLGWSAAEARDIDVLAACYPDLARRDEAREFMRSSAGTWQDFRTRTRDGRTIDTSWAHVRLSNGTILGVGQDMSERRRLEGEYRQAHKMEAVGRLAGGVAHDFNNLLGVITGYSELAVRQLEDGHPARGRIEQVVSAAERAARLTRQLLAFSRRQVLAPKVVDLNLLLSDLGKMLHRLIGEDVELIVRPGAGPEAVCVDPGQMEQVIMNLVVNARDAMPRGGTLTVETADLNLAAPLAGSHGPIPPGSYVMLSVSDTGSGIDPANVVQIFEPFFTTKPLGEGTGLGLSTVYGIVRQSGGHIEVGSQPAHGTTFRIYLPRVTEDSPRVSKPAPFERLAGDETILLVEDQQALREVIQETLQDRGYTILVAEGAQSALGVAERHPGPIHLLLTDVVMPRVSGPELAAQLVAARRQVKVLLMSGYTHDVLGRQGVQAQDYALIEKPFTSEVLARKIRAVLGHARSEATPA